MFQVHRNTIQKNKSKQINEQLKKLDNDVRNIFQKKTLKKQIDSSRFQNIEIKTPKKMDFDKLFKQYQSILQTHLLQRKQSNGEEQNRGSLTDQRSIRNKVIINHTTKNKSQHRLNSNKAALKIQKCWRGYWTRKVLITQLEQFYRDQMQMCNQMTEDIVEKKCIISQEVEYLETPKSLRRSNCCTPKRELISAIFQSFEHLNEQQIQAIQQIIYNIPQKDRVSIKVDQAAQTSIDFEKNNLLSDQSSLKLLRDLTSEKDFNESIRQKRSFHNEKHAIKIEDISDSVDFHRDSLDFQFSIPSSPKLLAQSPKYKSYTKSPQSNGDSQHFFCENKKTLNFDNKLNPLITSDDDFNFRRVSRFSDADDADIQIDQQLFTQSPKQLSSLQVEQLSMLILQQVIDECAQELIEGTNFRLFIEKNNRNLRTESNYSVGIQTNLGVINDYIVNLQNFILENYLSQFLLSMNFPYGLMPIDKLRIIHGYLVPNSSQNTLENYVQNEFHNSIQGRHKSSGTQEYENIHNRAIFDSFNESLNLFRPFYLINGLPYPWSFSEKHLTVVIINQQNITILFDKVKQKILDHSSALCGLIQEEEQIQQFGSEIKYLLNDQEGDLINLTKDNQIESVPQKPCYMQAIEQIRRQDSDYVGQIREERLQKVLLAEEDEKLELLMEITDNVFEHLIENMVEEIML